MAYSGQYQYFPNYYPHNSAVPDMLNQYKVQYQQPIPSPIAQQQPFTAPVQNNDMIWVQGEAGAKAYLVAPNTTITLWDTESKTIYIKSADASGVPSMRVLEFTEKNTNLTPKHECSCSKDFVNIQDFKALESKFESLNEKIDSLTKDKEIK